MKFKKGTAILELMLVMGLMAVLMPPLLTGLYTARSDKAQQSQRIQAVSLLRGTEEAVRNIRTQNWNTFTSITEGSPYHPTVSANNWVLSAGVGTVNSFTQKIVVSSVSRDATGKIVTSGGTNDPSTKQVVTIVTWSAPLSTTVSSTMYLTRYINNAPYSQTLQSQFNTDSLNNVVTTNTSGGEVILGPNPHAKWCSPTLSSQTIDLPDGPPVAVAARADAVSNSIPNDVLVAVAPYATSSAKMAYVNVSANQDPPVPSLRGIFSLDPAAYSQPTLIPTPTVIGLDNSFKTNDIKYYTSSSGKLYALLATTKPDKEIVAVLVNDNNDASNSEYQDPVNHIFKYWTYFNTKQYGFGGLAPTATPTPTPIPTATPTPTPTATPTPTPAIYNTGFANPTANLAETTNAGDNNGYQTTPTNAYTSNSTYAVDTDSGSNTGVSCAGTDKDKHRFYNYGFAVPAGSTINGVEVRLDAKADSTTGSPFICVQLSWDGGTTWTTAKTTATLTTALASYTLGSSADTWGRTWTNTNFSDANLRVRVIDVASNISRDFSLDWATVKVHYSGFTPSATPIPTATPLPTATPTPTSTPTPTPTPNVPNDQAPFGYGATSLGVQGDTGYLTSGGFLYVFDLSNIDSKSNANGLDQVGCRILLDGYDCQPGSPGYGMKYNAGGNGTTFGPTSAPIHNDCSDGGNIELNADNDVYPIKVSAPNPTPGTYAYVAVGGMTVPELDVVNTSSIPTGATLSNSSCGRGTTSGWGVIGTLDFNSANNTEEASNSVFVKSDGTRAYISSNGGIDADGNGQPDSKQFYILDTTNKSTPSFLLTNPSPTPKFGFYYGGVISPTPSGPIYHNDRLFPRRSMTVLNGTRAVLVGKDGLTPTPGVTGPEEYQVLDVDPNTTNPLAPTPGSSYEKNPGYCGGVNFDSGFNDLTSVTEADTDTFVYMVANTPDKQLKMIEGGPDVTYSNSGTIDSIAFDASRVATFNRFAATVSTPGTTHIYFQIAVANPSDGNCTTANYTFLGPAGTTDYLTDSYNPTGAPILIANSGTYSNPGRCFKYRATLTSTDSNSTPILNDVSVNYSP